MRPETGAHKLNRQDALRAALRYVPSGVLLLVLISSLADMSSVCRGNVPAPPRAFVTSDVPTVIAVPAPELWVRELSDASMTVVRAPWTVMDAVADEVRWVGLRSQRAPLAPSGAHVVARHTSGRYQQVVYRAHPDRLREIDLTDLLAFAEVSIVGEHGSRACTNFDGVRWYCGPDSWNYVGPTVQVIHGRPEHCLWLHPTLEGELRVRFPAVGMAPHLSLRYGVSDQAATGVQQGELVFELWVNDVLTQDFTHRVRRGFQRRTVPLDAASSVVELRVSAEDVGRRHFCVRGSFDRGGEP